MQVTFVDQDGTEYVANVEPGFTLMEVAVNHMVPGIDAECGGACACATCHVYVGPEWYDQLTPPDANEQPMLEFASDVTERSRLSCQVKLTEALDGMRVHLPPPR